LKIEERETAFQFSILTFQSEAGSDSFGNFSILNSHFTSHFQSAEYIFYPIDLILCFMRKKNKSKTGFKPALLCFMRTEFSLLTSHFSLKSCQNCLYLGGDINVKF